MKICMVLSGATCHGWSGLGAQILIVLSEVRIESGCHLLSNSTVRVREASKATQNAVVPQQMYILVAAFDISTLAGTFSGV